jgi:Spy/CpxP family protein refolding chaperone
MRRFPAFLLIVGLFAIAAVATRASAQDGPPGGPEGGGPRPPRGEGDGAPRGPGPGFHLIPRFELERISLTADQRKQIDDLEKETKAKLYKILTPKQQKILEAARPPRPRDGGLGGDRRRGGPDGGPGPGGDRPDGERPRGDQPPPPRRPAE